MLSLVCISQATSGQNRQNPFGPSNIGGSPSLIQTIKDTIDRPPLQYRSYPLTDLLRANNDLDTSIGRVHIVEHYYQEHFILSNLGSENSASTSSDIRIPDKAIRIGHHLYDQIFKKTCSPSLVEVNRSFMQVHFGQGFNSLSPVLGSSHLAVDFYRSFARRIYFNFSYRSLTDEGAILGDGDIGSQANSFKRIDLKLFQKSKSGNRVSYIHYDRPIMNEILSISDPNTAKQLDLLKSDQSVTFGNSIVVKDSLSGSVKYVWNSKLKFYKNRYSSLGSTIDSNDLALLLLDLSGDTLSYSNTIKGVSLSNAISLRGLGGDVRFGLDLSLIDQSLGTTFGQNFTEGIFSLDYNKPFSNKLQFFANGKVGFMDGSGLSIFKGELEYKISEDFEIDVQASIRRNIQSLAKRQLVVNDVLYQEIGWNALKGQDVKMGLNYLPTNTQIKVGLKSYKNLLVVDGTGLFEQISQPTQLIWTKIHQDWKVGPFYTSHHLLIQDITNSNRRSASKFAIPNLNYKGSVYFKLPLFKKKMSTNIGADIHVIPAFDTPEFYPTTGTFYNDSIDKREMILFVNPYFNAKVGPFLFFIKGINVTHRLLPRSTIERALTSGFPIYDFRIRFGMKWTLLD